MKLVELPKFSELPRKGNPVGVIPISTILPTGDRGMVFGRSKATGIPIGKIPGYWTCPYNGRITSVILTTNKGGYTVKIWKNSKRKSPTAKDSICSAGFSIAKPSTNKTILDLKDLSTLDVMAGDTFAVEITKVSNPVPTDIAGNVVLLKTEAEIEKVETEIKL